MKVRRESAEHRHPFLLRADVRAGGILQLRWVAVLLLVIAYIAAFASMQGVFASGVAQNPAGFFSTGTTVTASFLVANVVMLLAIRTEIPEPKRARWMRFFLWLIVAQFFGVLVSASWLYTFALASPAMPAADDFGVVVVVASWFIAMFSVVAGVGVVTPKEPAESVGSTKP